MITKDRPTKCRCIRPGHHPADVLEGSKEWLPCREWQESHKQGLTGAGES